MENLICNLWKLFIYISNYYHSKRSSRRCFQGNNFHHQVTGFVHVFSYVFFFFFFAFDNFLNFSKLKGKICTEKIMQWKIEVAPLIQELKSIVPVCMVHLLKSNTVFSECVRLLAWLRDLFSQYRMPSAILRNHL